jgi:DNA-nicking Smr family endonuclease
MTTRRAKRGASEEEQELFRDALKDATPLMTRARIVHVPRPPVSGPPSPRIVMPVFADVPAPPIGGHDEAKFRRGRSEPEGRIDLHGMTKDGAYRALIQFLMNAQADGKRLVLVITGKGGILRVHLPLWLGQSDLKSLVGGISEAHVRHGGSGAFYVTLRRMRR